VAGGDRLRKNILRKEPGHGGSLSNRDFIAAAITHVKRHRGDLPSW
jgi:hypothetical protein